METRIILADDHPILRYGLRKLIGTTRDLTVVGEVASRDGLLKMLESKSCDIVVEDMKMPGFNDGIKALKSIKEKYPGVKVIILSQFLKKNIIKEAISLDVDGYVAKEDVQDYIIDAVRKVLKGEKVFSPRVQSLLVNGLFKTPSGIDSLTTRELEVLKLIVSGKSRKEIGGILDISIPTVDFHKNNIKSKLNTNTNLGLYKISQDYGLV